ncbi:MAG: glycosyltransferase [Bacteroidota bacterium]|nr:glycosyltransferase [Bacteroidota bacterium]
MTATKITLSVLHVATAKTWRGGEQQVAYLTSELAKKLIRQYVLCTAESPMAEYCQNNHIPFFTAVKRSSVDISYARKIKDICKSNSISLVHAHDSHAHTFAVIAAVFGNTSSIIVSRRVDFKVNPGPFSKFKYNHPLLKRILCVSEMIKQLTLPAVDDPLKLVTIHSGIDFSRFQNQRATGVLHKEYDLPESARIIGNVAALAPHKDYATFVNTVSLLVKQLPDVYYFIIGEGDERTNIETIIRENNLEDRIIMTGFRNDMADILPELDLMLITSETEGLGTAILDAFACGVPVVATAAGGIPELVIHEKTGLLASVGDIQGLAQQVVRIMSEPELRKLLIDGAAVHLEAFTMEATASKTITEYLAVTGTEL